MALERMTIRISGKQIVQILLWSVGVLTVVGAVAMFVKLLFDRSVYGFMHAFDLSWDGNIPTWYASSSLLLCAILIFIIAYIERTTASRWTRYWFGLGWIFIFLSIDETATIHEQIGAALGTISPTLAGLGGLFNYTWVVFGIAAVTVVTVLYMRFFIDLPKRSRTLFFLAAAAFVGGALGIEMVNAWIADALGDRTIPYVAMTVVEEAFEMIGVLVFVYALLDYMSQRYRIVGVEIIPANSYTTEEEVAL